MINLEYNNNNNNSNYFMNDMMLPMKSKCKDLGVTIYDYSKKNIVNIARGAFFRLRQILISFFWQDADFQTYMFKTYIRPCSGVKLTYMVAILVGRYWQDRKCTQIAHKEVAGLDYNDLHATTGGAEFKIIRGSWILCFCV